MANVTLAELNEHAREYVEKNFSAYDFTGFRAHQETIDLDGDLIPKEGGSARRVELFGYNGYLDRVAVFSAADAKINAAISGGM